MMMPPVKLNERPLKWQPSKQRRGLVLLWQLEVWDLLETIGECDSKRDINFPLYGICVTQDML